MRSIVVALVACLGLAVGLYSGCSAGGDNGTGGGDDCPVGSEGCACSPDGLCYPPLVCLSRTCVDPSSGGGNGGGTSVGGAGGLAIGGNGGHVGCEEGCQGVDVVFALDGSLSMQEEVAALAATQAFDQIVGALAGINCGQIDYRIGVTGDNDNGWRTPAGWPGGDPWFDSLAMSDADIAVAFSAAASALLGATGTPAGCEHVLSSATDLLATDSTGFLRPEAILVLVLVTDVDDYGAYDQLGGHSCGAIGCTTAPPSLQSLYDTLVGLKAGDPAGLAAVVVAGDPAIDGGLNMCSQPCSCVGCAAFHADRLWQFAGMLEGTNGSTSDMCAGAASVPLVIQEAFAGAIDIACKGFEPPR